MNRPTQLALGVLAGATCSVLGYLLAGLLYHILRYLLHLFLP